MHKHILKLATIRPKKEMKRRGLYLGFEDEKKEGKKRGLWRWWIG